MSNNTNTFKRSILAISISQALLLSATQVSAATITVDSTADALTDDGNCTLREAVQAANTDTAVDNCLAGSGTDTIDFDNSLSGSTITLGGTEIDISSSLTVDGDIDNDSSPDITIDGANTSSIFEVTSYTSETINLDGLTLQNANDNATTGWTGGAVVAYYASESTNMTISNSVITGNNAYNGAAISFKGDLTISNSTISNNQTRGSGAGIYMHSNPSYNALTIENSTFDSNTSNNYSGGAVWVHGSTLSINISGSTFSNNTAADYGGAILVHGSSSAVNMTISNSTFSGNTATDYAGGAIASGNSTGMITITHSTFVDNNANYVSGIDLNGPVTITNSILANTNGDCTTSSGSVTMTNTLVKDGGTSCGPPTLTGDPDLGPLQDNGGPTLTHLPNSTSPVIDAGDNTDCGSGKTVSTDQRGEARDDGSCDIGAVEVQQSSGSSSSSGGSMTTVGIANRLLLALLLFLPAIRKQKKT